MRALTPRDTLGEFGAYLPLPYKPTEPTKENKRDRERRQKRRTYVSPHAVTTPSDVARMSKKGETIELRNNFTKTVLAEGDGPTPEDGLLCTLHYHGMVSMRLRARALRRRSSRIAAACLRPPKRTASLLTHPVVIVSFICSCSLTTAPSSTRRASLVASPSRSISAALR